ncbi:MAG: LapA family protein [Aestuariivita sp.]|nr:LapA family protein [Aestuariivita sp.]MCY4201492.1 LapA family protein [Aestuariivita sp.]MCY4287735.1 LapA family protein [Aestuariivita sp.]MCY4347025.1 LapA family protein [Aestuariivita sp.]
MFYLRLTTFVVFAAAFVFLAMGNREIVTISLLPEEVARYSGWQWQLNVPLYAAIYFGIVAGLVLGFVWEWFREHKFRRDASAMGREARELKREVSRMKGAQGTKQDEVLALLEDKG